METPEKLQNLHYYLHSDPTYEAWKLLSPPRFQLHLRYSDPTYEALKPTHHLTQMVSSRNSDPTYEAWEPLNFRRLLKRVSVLQSYL